MTNVALPVGAPVAPQAVLKRPERRVFTGPRVSLVPLDADAHAAEPMAIQVATRAVESVYFRVIAIPF